MGQSTILPIGITLDLKGPPDFNCDGQTYDGYNPVTKEDLQVGLSVECNWGGKFYEAAITGVNRRKTKVDVKFFTGEKAKGMSIKRLRIRALKAKVPHTISVLFKADSTVAKSISNGQGFALGEKLLMLRDVAAELTTSVYMKKLYVHLYVSSENVFHDGAGISKKAALDWNLPTTTYAPVGKRRYKTKTNPPRPSKVINAEEYRLKLPSKYVPVVTFPCKGSPYRAPEDKRHHEHYSDVGPFSDVFGLGFFIWELLTEDVTRNAQTGLSDGFATYFNPETGPGDVTTLAFKMKTQPFVATTSDKPVLDELLEVMNKCLVVDYRNRISLNEAHGVLHKLAEEFIQQPAAQQPASVVTP